MAGEGLAPLDAQRAPFLLIADRIALGGASFAQLRQAIATLRPIVEGTAPAPSEAAARSALNNRGNLLRR